MTAQCKAKTRTGARCTAYAVKNSHYCFTHDPKKARERARAHKRGGRNRAARKVGEWEGRIETIGDALRFVNDLVIPDLIALENTVPRARALIAAAQAAVKTISDGELEARVAAIEAVLKNREVRQ